MSFALAVLNRRLNQINDRLMHLPAVRGASDGGGWIVRIALDVSTPRRVGESDHSSARKKHQYQDDMLS